MYLRHEIGRIGEISARNYLEKNNHIILTINYRSYFGEIDIIARDKKSKEIVFVEVKTRSSSKFGEPIDAVNFKKMNKIYKTAQIYIYIYNLEMEKIRFDVIEVFMKNMEIYRINHVKDVFFS